MVNELYVLMCRFNPLGVAADTSLDLAGIAAGACILTATSGDAIGGCSTSTSAHLPSRSTMRSSVKRSMASFSPCSSRLRSTMSIYICTWWWLVGCTMLTDAG